MNRKVKLRIRDLHDHITCHLCRGYLIDAATVVECLHSFCRTCIVHHLVDHKSCPVCRCQIHKTRPLLNIRHDQALQDIVYTLVPGLRHNEMQRRKRFWSDNKDLRSWGALTPEELGDTDQSATSTGGSKVCLSIEPNEPMKNKLYEDSEWVKLDRSFQKRYIRCSRDVTVLHLHKFIRMKLNEDDRIEILLFHGDNVLPQNFSLSDVIETFPCSITRTLDLSFGMFAPKLLKRKLVLEQVPNNTIVTARKKKRLPSATPQLKAFFNSQMSPKSLKPPQRMNISVEKAEEPRKATNNLKLKSEDTLSDRRDGGECTIQGSASHDVNNGKEVSLDSEGKTGIKSTNEDSAKEIKPQLHSISNHVAEEYLPGNQKRSHKQEAVQEHKHPPPDATRLPVGDMVPAEPCKKTTEPLQCYSVLNIPVAEAVLSKPPTPVESPTHIYPTKVKRSVETNRPFVSHKQIAKQSDPIQHKGRRKPINPTHHGFMPTKNTPEKPVGSLKDHLSSSQSRLTSLTQDHLQSKYETVRISAPQQQGQFILLTTRASDPSTRYFPSPQSTPKETDRDQPSQQKQYERLNNDQVHRVALDAVRNMGKVILPNDKRPGAVKRPILPKTTSNMSLVVQNAIPTSAPPTRNIFQNEKITYPMTSTTKHPALSAKVTSRSRSSIERDAALRNQEILLEQIAAAVANSQVDKKSATSVTPSTRSGPPPPYGAPFNTSSSVSLLNQGRVMTSTTSAVTFSDRGLGAGSTRTNQLLVPSSSVNQSNVAAYQRPLPNAGHSQKVIPQNSRFVLQTSGSNHAVTRHSINYQSALRHPAPVQLLTRYPASNQPSTNQNMTLRQVSANNARYNFPSTNQTLPRSSYSDQKLTQHSLAKRQLSRFVSANQTRPRHPLSTHSTLSQSFAVSSFSSSNRVRRSIPGGQRRDSTNQHLSTVKGRFPNPNQALYFQRNQDKKSAPLRTPPQVTFTIATPPAGTKSPWASRTYDLPSHQDSDFSPPVKRIRPLSPPHAHQHHPKPLQSDETSLAVSDMPLELTSKRKSVQSPQPAAFVTSCTAPNTSSQDQDQPLCLIVKKK